MAFRIDLVPVRDIALGRIAFDDETFALRCGRDAAPGLSDSLRRHGMLSPPLLRETESPDSHIVVCGFSRLIAWRDLGRASVAARVAARGAADEDLLSAAIDDNLGGRGLNAVEQAMALEKLEPSVGRERLASEFLPRLGRKASPVVLERLLATRRLPERVQTALARGAIGEGVASALAPFEPREQSALLDTMAALRLTTGASRDLVRETFEVCRRDGLDATALLAKLGFDPGEPPDPSRLPAERQRLLDALRRRRYPVLTALRENYERAHAALSLGPDARLRPPKDFEGGAFRLEARLETVADLRRLTETLADRLGRREDLLESLFHPETPESGGLE